MPKVLHIFFSPTASSHLAGKILGQTLASQLELELQEQDFTLPDQRKELPGLDRDDVLICSFPVYSGRVPTPFANVLQSLNGHGCKAIALAVYGNRAFDDALLEATDILQTRDCELIAAATAIAQHTFAPEIAHGRPNAADQQKLEEFARKIAARIKSGQHINPAIPGNRPWLVPRPMPQLAPLTNEDCNYCGICAHKCPMGIIDAEDEHKIGDGCILCNACVKYCPQKAKTLPPPFLQAVRQRLLEIASTPKEPELFM